MLNCYNYVRKLTSALRYNIIIPLSIKLRQKSLEKRMVERQDEEEISQDMLLKRLRRIERQVRGVQKNDC